ncbi:tyrosine-type recombinase/integrase [Kordiimonas sp.]|uniref:tyrosine-type recombinase/integrase n=1 Tax=Kordiimonas sp. TaxID=1970157 RepID=UPI003A901A22
MKIIDFFSDYYRPQRLLGKSSETTRLYRLSIRSFGKTLGTVARLPHLTDVNVTRHMQTVLDAGRSKATANKDRSQLLTLWRHASRLGMVDSWPNVPQLVEPERTPEAWLPEEFDRLLKAVDSQQGKIGEVPRSLWWRAIILLCLDTGERITAVRTAKWDWFYGEWVKVPAESRKGKHRDRLYRLNAETTAELENMRGYSRKDVFPWPYCDGYLWTLFGKLLKEANLPSGRRDKFHKIRRTTGSVAHAAGLDAQEVLDHQYRRTTQRYIDPRFTRTQQACDVIGGFLGRGDATPTEVTA